MRVGQFTRGKLCLEGFVSAVHAVHCAAQWPGAASSRFERGSNSLRPLRSSACSLFRHKGCALKALSVTHHYLKQVAGEFGLVHTNGFRVKAQQ